MELTQKNAYVIISHNLKDNYIIENINKIYNDCNCICDIWLLYDNKNQDIDLYRHKLKPYIFTYDYNYLFKYYKGLIYDNDLSQLYDKHDYEGNSIFPVFYFCENHIYNKYIIQEYDTIFTGNDYKYLLNKTNILNNDIQILFEKEISRVKPHWYWYRKGKFNINVNRRYYNTLFNYYVISYDLLKQLYDFYLLGNYGHYEMVIPSYVLNNDVSYDILSNYDNINTQLNFYTYSDEIIENKSKINNLLIHPIKNDYQYNLLLSKHNNSGNQQV